MATMMTSNLTSLVPIGGMFIERSTPEYGTVGDKAVQEAASMIDDCSKKIRGGCARNEYTQLWHDVMLSVALLELAVNVEQLSASATFEAKFWIENGPGGARIPEDYQVAWREEYEKRFRGPAGPINGMAGQRQTAPLTASQ
ncbi:hypothetical protein H1R20_g12248, partial [Candolleomyces eurysporus]